MKLARLSPQTDQMPISELVFGALTQNRRSLEPTHAARSRRLIYRLFRKCEAIHTVLVVSVVCSSRAGLGVKDTAKLSMWWPMIDRRLS
jgi:hypothetical protein